MGVMDHSFDVLFLNLGAIKRIYCDKLSLKNYSFVKDNGVSQLILTWADSNPQNSSSPTALVAVQVITVFCLVDIELFGTGEPMKYSVSKTINHIVKCSMYYVNSGTFVLPTFDGELS